MNDATPRKLAGSLLERAAARYDFAARPVAVPPVPLAEPAPLPPRPAPRAASRVETDFMVPPRSFVPGRHAGIDRDRLLADGFILPGAPVTGLAEEFRIIKRQLLSGVAKNDGGRGQRILVTSPQPGDGKTFSAINLALSLAAEKDREIILIDGDFAKPEIARTLGLDEAPGLLDAIADPAIDLASVLIGTDVPQLSILTTGTRSNDDSELIASPRMRALLDELTADPRRILVFDSPPALAASAASSLALHVGRIVMVVRADRTGESELREAVALLDGPADIALLLNGARFAPGGKRFGAYYGNGA